MKETSAFSREGPSVGYSDFDFLHNITPGKHFYQFYKSTEDYLQTMVHYFQAGLQKGQACLWLVSEKWGVENICSLADQMIPNFLFYLTSGQFEIRAAETWYLKEGVFDKAQALGNAEHYIRQVLGRGFHQLRGAGDAGAIPKSEWPRLLEYEQEVDTLIKGSPFIATCAYPILLCTLQDTKMVLDCHDGVLIGKF